jgi:hypothetical protein
VTIDGAQEWLEKQNGMLDDTKNSFRNQFTFDTRAPLELVQFIDEFVDIWRAPKNAEKENETARATATSLLRYYMGIYM